MHLGKESAYAVFAVAHLATQEEGARLTVHDLTECGGVPADALAAILPKLVDAAILRRDAGPPERFALGRLPGATTLLAIVEAVEGREPPDLLLPLHSAATAGLVSEEQPGEKPAAGAGPAVSGQAAWSDRLAWQPVVSLAASVLGAHTIAHLVHGGAAGRP
jgi:DNA-binding IscR family transcriptional regulator